MPKYLGHKSPTMMQAYAEIHDDTLRAKYEEFVSHAIDVNGRRTGWISARPPI